MTSTQNLRKKIRKYQNINNDSTDGSGGKIVDDYEFEPFLLFWLGTRTLTFIPKYSRYFNSFIAPSLPEVSFACTNYNRDKLPDVPAAPDVGDDENKAGSGPDDELDSDDEPDSDDSGKNSA